MAPMAIEPNITSLAIEKSTSPFLCWYTFDGIVEMWRTSVEVEREGKVGGEGRKGGWRRGGREGG